MIAVCGGATVVLRSVPESERWCYGERRRQPGTWELRTEPPTVDEDGREWPSWWEPMWVYRCNGCGHDRRWLG